ncbi:MAG: undecaprenyl-phosphate glucose phosphotransferase [Flavobacteriaceae bacterium]|nr:undecaprenyl-phosphate glucose phosphotransferase [Flavobacteriaceae bacterium]
MFDKRNKLKKRYSIYIKPISIIANLIIINVTLFFFLKETYNNYWYVLYINTGWLIVSYYLNFYSLRRFNKIINIISLLFSQFLFFSFVYFSFFSFTSEPISFLRHLEALGFIFLLISLFRFFYLYMLKKYRDKGGNFRNVIIIGTNKSTQKISEFLNTHTELGYKIIGYFSDQNKNEKSYLGNVDDSFEFALTREVDEIYCSVSELSNDQIKSFIHFADNNLKILKLIPESKDDFTTKKMDVEYYDYTPILSLRTIPFDNPINQISKKIFDIIFSLVVIIFLLSWLTPLLFVLIKLESKGPLFFKQTRDGLIKSKFVCYKFRSMHTNEDADSIPATKQDIRITKIGKFIRKTSIDELPQFFNVFKGDMSIVGPRPHMLSQTKKYAKTVDKFMVRHFVIPGITGLAQVRGYRGEVEKQEDIENRVKLDIFYIENWSFSLDLRIIGQTIINILKGEDKAY